MEDVLVEVADKVAAVINAGSFSQAVTAQRTKKPRHEIKDLVSAKADVIPMSRKNRQGSGSRTRVYAEFTVQIGVHRHAKTVALQDGVMLLAQEIDDLFRKNRFTTAGGKQWSWVSSDYDVAYSPEHLEEKQTLLAVMSLTVGMTI